MKKLVLTLIFLVVGITSFARSNSIKIAEYFGTCTVTITEYNSDGTADIYVYRFETSTERDCANAALALRQAHVNQQ